MVACSTRHDLFLRFLEMCKQRSTLAPKSPEPPPCKCVEKYIHSLLVSDLARLKVKKTAGKKQ